MDLIHYWALGIYTAYLVFLRWRIGKLEIWMDGHELDHADDERLLTKVKALSGNASPPPAQPATEP